MNITIPLRDPKPHLLQPIPRYPPWPMPIRRIQGRLPSMNIHLQRPKPPRPLQDLPEHKQSREDGNTNIRRDEVVGVKPFMRGGKSIEAVEEDDDGEEGEAEVSGVWLAPGFEDEGVAADALGFESGAEFEVGEGDGNVGAERGDGGDVQEPGECAEGVTWGAGEVG